MSTTRGYIGKRGSGYVIDFTQAGVDYFSASGDDFIFRSDIEQFRPLLIGSVLVSNGQTKIVAMPKTFTQLPWIFVHLQIGYTLSTPNDLFILTLRFNSNIFQITNKSGATRTFRYAIFDNDQGQQVLF